MHINSEVLVEDLDDSRRSTPKKGDTVRVQGLLLVPQYNDNFAVVIGLDSDADRFMLKFSPDTDAVKVRRSKVQFPAHCPACNSEVTSNACFACNYGLSDPYQFDDSAMHEHAFIPNIVCDSKLPYLVGDAHFVTEMPVYPVGNQEIPPTLFVGGARPAAE